VGDNDLFLSQQEVVRTPVTERQAEILRETAEKHGWWFSDYNKYIRDDQVSNAVDQAGIDTKGRVVFIDYGARSPMNRQSLD
jgi:hypothetical protein